MLESLNASVRVLAKRGVPDPSSLTSFEERFGAVSEYRELLGETGEIELGHESNRYLRIWAPDTCLEMDEAYNITDRVHGSIPIGDDGGGRVILYMDGQEGWGLYVCGFGALDRDEARFLSRDLRSLLVGGEGWINL